MILTLRGVAVYYAGYGFFSWRRTMLLRFQRMEAAEEVYHEIELQAQQLEYDYYSLCVRHPVPFTRPKVAFYTNYPEAWVSYYQAKTFSQLIGAEP